MKKIIMVAVAVIFATVDCNPLYASFGGGSFVAKGKPSVGDTVNLDDLLGVATGGGGYYLEVSPSEVIQKVISGEASTGWVNVQVVDGAIVQGWYVERADHFKDGHISGLGDNPYSISCSFYIKNKERNRLESLCVIFLHKDKLGLRIESIVEDGCYIEAIYVRIRDGKVSLYERYQNQNDASRCKIYDTPEPVVFRIDYYKGAYESLKGTPIGKILYVTQW